MSTRAELAAAFTEVGQHRQAGEQLELAIGEAPGDPSLRASLATAALADLG